MQLSSVYKILGVVWGQGETIETGNMWSKTSVSYRNRRQRRYSGCAGRKIANSDFWDQWSIFFDFILFSWMFIDLHCVYYFNGIYFISQEMLEVAGTDFPAGIAATNHVLAHTLKDPWPLRNSFTCCWNSRYQILFCLHISVWRRRLLPHVPHLKLPSRLDPLMTHENLQNCSAALYICSFINRIYMFFDMWSTLGTFVGCMKLWFMCVPSRVLWFFALELNSSYAC